MKRHRPHLATWLRERRLAVFASATLTIVGATVFWQVLGGPASPLDESLMRGLRRLLPASVDGVFGVITRSGSALVVLPTASIAVLGLVLARRRFEAVLVTVSTLSASLLSYLIKSATGRARPELWETQWYWGSSFPSGHTLSTAAFGTALALAVGRIRPGARRGAMIVAVLWALAVALSRVVLGVHWPTDVLAALCLGMLVPLLITLGYELHLQRRSHADAS